MSSLLLAFVTLFIGVLVYDVDAGEYCTIDYSYSYSTRTDYCDYGCCGSSYNDDRSCCDAPSEHNNVAVYVGGGLGGTFSFLFTCCCIYYCCCRADNLIHVI